MSTNKELVPAPSLPVKMDDWVRKLKSEPNLNDEVEAVIRALAAEDDQARWEEFLAFRRATYDAHSVEGSMSVDNVQSAQLVREYAQEGSGRFSLVSREKLAVLVKSLNVVMKRYGFDRNTRRDSLGGELVGGDSSTSAAE